VKLNAEAVGFIHGSGTNKFATVYKTRCFSVHLHARAHTHILHSSDLHAGVMLLTVFVLQSQKKCLRPILKYAVCLFVETQSALIFVTSCALFFC